MSGPEKATHLLECAHVLGGRRSRYFMRCTLVKPMSKGRAKIVVYGERFWPDKGGQRVRYVPAERLTPLKFCYQCDAAVVWLAPDGRCGKCTRLTLEEIAGGPA